MSQENIGGGAALDALLQTLPAKIETNIMRGALRAGAAVYLAQVKQNLSAISKTGALLRSARITTRKGKDGQVSASVKVGNREAFYAQMVEFGTRAHVIVAPPGGAMNVNGALVKNVDHPGSEKKPYMRPAADENFTQSVAAVQKKIRDRLRAQGLDVPDPPLPGEDEQ